VGSCNYSKRAEKNTILEKSTNGPIPELIPFLEFFLHNILEDYFDLQNTNYFKRHRFMRKKNEGNKLTHNKPT